MMDSERQKFLDWYAQQKDKNFNLQRELKAYCDSDVTVLRKCCLKFRKLFMEIGDLDPFVCSITIASACNKYYRKHCMPRDKIAIIPYGGYRNEEKQSLLALRWLKWLAETTGKYIRHKLNGGEVKIGPYRADGISVSEMIIWEMNGCAVHGCLSCFPKRDRLTPNGQMTMAEAFQRTLDRKRFLESMGYTIVEKWEHELRMDLKKDKKMAEFFKNVKIVDPMDPREAFYGGRTNATVLHYKVRMLFISVKKILLKSYSFSFR
jgi:hypothetical protein